MRAVITDDNECMVLKRCIDNAVQNFKLIGCSKVYGDEAAAKKLSFIRNARIFICDVAKAANVLKV